MTQQLLQHPVLACTDAVDAALKDVADVDPVFMSLADKRRALLALEQLTTRLSALRLTVIAAATDVADAEGHRDVAAWLAHHTRGDLTTHRRDHRLAKATDQRWTVVGAALRDGRVNLDQAHAITRALDDLPTDPATGVTDQIRARAEEHLTAAADTFGPKDLTRLGRKILEVVAPDLFDDLERKKLLDEEHAARHHTTLSIRRRGDGTSTLTGRLPDASADRLRTYLEAFTAPRHDTTKPGAGNGLGEKVAHDVRLGHAFTSMLEILDATRLPVHGGNATTVVITIDLASLISGLGTATLPDGAPITAGDARRLACTANLVPAVLDTGSHVLDLGHTTRLFTAAQRRALAIRDRECRAHGCTIPATWCEAHHLTPWSHRGPTDLDNGVLLCSHHHHRIHDDRYLHDRHPNGDIRFTRRR